MIEVLTDPEIWLFLLAISALGALARLTNYYAGQRGKEKIESLYPRIKPETWERVINSYQRLGATPLLIASIPLIGTLLTIGAGMAGIGRTPFLVVVTISKVIRNWILVLIFLRLL